MPYGQAIGGALGSIAGSFIPIPGVGTALGGAIGSGLGSLGDYYYSQRNQQGQPGQQGQPDQQNGSFLWGNPSGYQTVNPYLDWQQKLMQQMGQNGLSQLMNPYQGFGNIENQAMNQFNQQIVPGLAERCTGGTGGAISSPAFASQVGGAGADMMTNLAAMRENYGFQNRSQGMQMLNMGLAPQQQYLQTPEQQGILGPMLNAALPHIGNAGMQALGGYMNAKPGEGFQGAKRNVANYFSAAGTQPQGV